MTPTAKNTTLTRIQAERALALADAHAHHWGGIALPEEGATIDVATIERLAGNPGPLGGITRPELDERGHVVHVTGSGRLSWDIAADGTTALIVSRPTAAEAARRKTLSPLGGPDLSVEAAALEEGVPVGALREHVVFYARMTRMIQVLASALTHASATDAWRASTAYGAELKAALAGCWDGDSSTLVATASAKRAALAETISHACAEDVLRAEVTFTKAVRVQVLQPERVLARHVCTVEEVLIALRADWAAPLAAARACCDDAQACAADLEARSDQDSVLRLRARAWAFGARRRAEAKRVAELRAADVRAAKERRDAARRSPLTFRIDLRGRRVG